MAFSFSPRTVTDGLILNLDAANNRSYISGSTTWTDLSRSNINGTLTNGPTFNTASGGSIIFDGTDDYVLSPDNTTLRPTIFTIDVWFRPTSFSTFNTLIVKPVNGPVWTSPFLSYMIRLQTSGTLLQCGTNNGSYQALDTSLTFLTNTNYNITFTYNSSTRVATVYRNGAQVNTTTFTAGGITYSTSSLLIGAGYGASPTGEHFAGNIFNIKMYDKVLTPTEVLQNYNSLKTRFGL